MAYYFADIYPSQPARALPIDKSGMVRDIAIKNVDAEEELQEIKENLHSLTISVPNISINDLLR